MSGHETQGRESLNVPERLRCKRKKNCAVAWPESCPYWNNWACPVEPHEAQEPKS